MVPGKTCQTCAAFAALQTACRRHAPTMVPVQQPNGAMASMGMYPATTAEEWCCEWLPEEKVVVLQ